MTYDHLYGRIAANVNRQDGTNLTAEDVEVVVTRRGRPLGVSPDVAGDILMEAEEYGLKVDE